MKKCIMVGYEEEKLLALRMYAEQRGVSVEEELAQAAEAMYQKVVPANVRAFVDMKVESQKPKRKGRMLPPLLSGTECGGTNHPGESNPAEVSGLLLWKRHGGSLV